MSKNNHVWKVIVTEPAEKDLIGIITFIGEREGLDMAEAILDKFIKARNSLSELPERGRIPPELLHVNILSYREIQAAPYRIIYQVNKQDHSVSLHMVVDGRRNIMELLKERLLAL